MRRNLRYKILFLSFAVLLFPLKGLTVDRTMALLIEKEIQKHNLEIIKIRCFLHMNPELSNREYEKAKLVASELVSLGLEVKKGVAKTGDEGSITLGIKIMCHLLLDCLERRGHLESYPP